MLAGKNGIVYLVGAGPGDPGLLTIKGRECLSKADIVIYDYLANRIFLEYARDGADLNVISDVHFSLKRCRPRRRQERRTKLCPIRQRLQFPSPFYAKA